ncbi:peptidase C39 family protein [Corallococcus sp. H22C18031201]|nr:peptidase C39 family protein [Corallococcus sp. H22C18031201]
MNARARWLSALLVSLATACASQPPSSLPGSSTDDGPTTRLWRRGAEARDFERFTRDGTVLAADGALVLSETARASTVPFPTGAPPDAGTSATLDAYRLGTAVSELQAVSGGFDSVVPSFEAQTPPGTWVQVWVAARIEGRWTRDYELGVWASERDTVSRHSVNAQEDADGAVATDTLNLKRRADALRVTVGLYATRPDASPRVRALTAAVTDTRRTAEDSAAERTAWGTALEVPGYSQMLYPDGGEVWCSPTSTTMLLGYWSRKLGRATLEEPVPQAAAHTYDVAYQGTGNWSFNTAYASARGSGELQGLVARLDTFAQVERLIAAGLPVSISIAFEEGELTGAPSRRTDGHLIVVRGFTPEGDVLCNDPAARSNEGTAVTYRRSELWRAWRHSRGAAYVLWPTGTALPPDVVEWLR